MSKPFCPLIKPEINQESIGSTNPMHGTRQKPWPPPPCFSFSVADANDRPG